MPQLTDAFDLGQLRLSAGEGRRLDLHVCLNDLLLGGEHYAVHPRPLPARLDVSRMGGSGYALRLRFRAEVAGPCMRCLVDARPSFEVDAREVDQPNAGEELDSPYVDPDAVLDLHGWARDALALALPAQIVCQEDCRGLCPTCGENLNENPTHHHEPEPDPRWAKLRELNLTEDN